MIPASAWPLPASIDLLDDALVLTWSDDPSPHRIRTGLAEGQCL